MGVVNHGQGKDGRMTSTAVLSVRIFEVSGLESLTKAKCSYREQNDGEKNEHWTSSTRQRITSTLEPFEAAEDVSIATHRTFHAGSLRVHRGLRVGYEVR